jgi:predicted fused transcriptional regulator/phosphomethylpyrimidine kinase
VAFDPALLAVHRVAILKRFGQEVEVLERRQPPLSEDERDRLYAAALARTHALYARGGSDIDPIVRVRSRDVVAVDRLRRAASRVAMT